MKRLAELLTRTCRTFTLSMGLLPETLRQEVSVAYLLLRVADTLEDADRWTPLQRVAALSQLDVLVGVCDAGAAARESARWKASEPCEEGGCLDLIGELPSLLEALAALDLTARATIVRHLRRTVSGMIHFLTRGRMPGERRLDDLRTVRRYCYVVAGVVAELLTELFVEQGYVPRSEAPALWEKAAAFGEGLQLVDILEEEEENPSSGRSILPPGIDRSELFGLAYDDLDIAESYIRTLRTAGASTGIVGFASLPLRLARAKLDRVVHGSSGATTMRTEVCEHVQHVTTIG